jgi:hypothetical protein
MATRIIPFNKLFFIYALTPLQNIEKHWDDNTATSRWLRRGKQIKLLAGDKFDDIPP